LSALIQHPTKIQQLSQAGRSWVEQRRSWASMASVIASVYTHCHTSEGLLKWELDVLPSTINNGRLTGVPLGLNHLKVSVPSNDELSWLSEPASLSDHWQLSAGSIDLTPNLSVQSGEHHFNTWLPTIPVYARPHASAMDHPNTKMACACPKQHALSQAIARQSSSVTL
jgi:hypothetical protein